MAKLDALGKGKSAVPRPFSDNRLVLLIPIGCRQFFYGGWPAGNSIPIFEPLVQITVPATAGTKGVKLAIARFLADRAGL